MQEKPIILVTSFGLPMFEKGDMDYLCVKHPYIENVQACGAIPLVVPLRTEEQDLVRLSNIADGLLIPGGEDIHPIHYSKEDIHEKSGPFSYDRDTLELTLAKLFIQAGKPVFGICRGSQIINVALGGTLHQDIPSETVTEIFHDQPHLSKFERYTRNIHTVHFLPETVLESFFGCENITINSAHHQAVKEVAPDLRVGALGEDGIIEAIESKDMETKWILGVQWHPEMITKTHPEQTVLFQVFVDAARERSSS